MSAAKEILEGLKLPQKSISPKFFYDERGSALFEEICRQPEYYLTRTEQGILETHADEITALFGKPVGLIEFGSGSSLKTRLLLSSLGGRCTYVPIDISEEVLLREARRLKTEYPEIHVIPICADFTKPLQLPDELVQSSAKRVLFFPGSTIGNFEPEDALALLRGTASFLGPGGLLLMGVDLVKDRKTLEAAYNDSQGVTAEFNLNLLRRLNEELKADFKPQHFAHRALFNAERSRIEMHLMSRTEQFVRIAGHNIRLRRGETIHTENSYKYTDESLMNLANRAGFTSVKRWTDSRRFFAVDLLACL